MSAWTIVGTDRRTIGYCVRMPRDGVREEVYWDHKLIGHVREARQNEKQEAFSFWFTPLQGDSKSAKLENR